MQSSEYLELKGIMLDVSKRMDLFFPDKLSLSSLVATTGKTRQAIREFLINNYEPEVDFWKEGGKIFVSQKTAIAIIQRNKR